MRSAAARAWLLVAVTGLAATPPARSGDLRLEPVPLSLHPGEESTTLWLSNTGERPLLAQVRLFSWVQQDGGEVLGATDSLAVSPPLLQVAPHARQRLRLVRLRPGAPATETAHRLIVEELSARDASADAGASGRRRYSIPVFTLPATTQAPARLAARIERNAAGEPVLRLRNSGGRHARVAALAFVDAHGKRRLLAPGLAGYVLAGAYKDWPLPADLDVAPPGHFEADVDGQALRLAPGPPPPAAR